MVTPSQTAAANNVRAILEQIVAMPIDTLANNPNHGSGNFAEVLGELESCLGLSEELLSAEIDVVPTVLLQGLFTYSDNLHTTLAKIQGLQTTSHNFHEARQNLLERFQKQVGPHHQASVVVLLVAARAKANLSGLLDEVRASLESELSALREVREDVENKARDIDAAAARVQGIEADAKAAAHLVTLAKYSGLFRDAARRHGRAALGWLVMTMGAFVGTAWFIYEQFIGSGIVDDPSAGGIASPGGAVGLTDAMVARVSLSVLGLLVAGLSAKNYRARRHLATVAEHRFAALNTFETFVKQADDPQTKDAVLLEAARCIYGHVPSGYLGGDSDAPDNRVVEIIKLARGG